MSDDEKWLQIVKTLACELLQPISDSFHSNFFRSSSLIASLRIAKCITSSFKAVLRKNSIYTCTHQAILSCFTWKCIYIDYHVDLIDACCMAIAMSAWGKLILKSKKQQFFLRFEWSVNLNIVKYFFSLRDAQYTKTWDTKTGNLRSGFL